MDEDEEGEEGPYSMLLEMRRGHWCWRGRYDRAYQQRFVNIVIVGHNSSPPKM
jgi:hypothetical protein